MPGQKGKSRGKKNNKKSRKKKSSKKAPRTSIQQVLTRLAVEARKTGLPMSTLKEQVNDSVREP